jgi:peptide/nickel transport system permease protein
MMSSLSILRSLAVRAATLIGVFFVVMLLLVLTLGLTGFSDRILSAVVGEQIRAERSALAERIRDPEQLENVLRERQRELEDFYGLNTPWYLRLPGMALRVMRLDLGEARQLRSFDGSNRVIDIVLDRLPNTMLLLTTSLFITAAAGLLLGVYMATQAGAWLDRATSVFAAVTYAIPTWWIGILLILFLSVRWRILPSGGMYSTPPPVGGVERFLDLATHALLPVLTLVLVSVGPYIYAIRTITLNIAQEDHVTMARARGLPENRVRLRHILRVAAPPIVTGLIFGLAGSLSGSILVETVFNWQGMGRLYYDALAGTPDENVIVALTFMFTLMYVGVRLLLEVLYIFLDPRVGYAD